MNMMIIDMVAYNINQRYGGACVVLITSILCNYLYEDESQFALFLYHTVCYTLKTKEDVLKN